MERYQFCTGMKRNGTYDLIDVFDGKVTMDEFVKQLTIDDLIHLLGGQPNTGVANTFGLEIFRNMVCRLL